jgi:hypothetical protein
MNGGFSGRSIQYFPSWRINSRIQIMYQIHEYPILFIQKFWFEPFIAGSEMLPPCTHYDLFSMNIEIVQRVYKDRLLSSRK